MHVHCKTNSPHWNCSTVKVHRCCKALWAGANQRPPNLTKSDMNKHLKSTCYTHNISLYTVQYVTEAVACAQVCWPSALLPKENWATLCLSVPSASKANGEKHSLQQHAATAWFSWNKTLQKQLSAKKIEQDDDPLCTGHTRALIMCAAELK